MWSQCGVNAPAPTPAAVARTDTPSDTPTVIAIDVEADPDGDHATDTAFVFEDERSDGVYAPYVVANERLQPDCPQPGHGKNGLQCRTAVYHCDPHADGGYELSVLKFDACFQFSGA